MHVYVTTYDMETLSTLLSLNTLGPRQNGRHFTDDVFKWIFLNGNVWVPIKSLQSFVPNGPIYNNSELVKLMAWRRIGDKPLSETTLTRLTDAYMYAAQ